MKVYSIRRTITEYYVIHAENEKEALEEVDKQKTLDIKTKDEVILSIPDFERIPKLPFKS